jgi:hypothetical protein
MNPTPLQVAEYQGGFFMISFGSAETIFHKPFIPVASHGVFWHHNKKNHPIWSGSSDYFFLFFFGFFVSFLFLLSPFPMEVINNDY